jgi:hypothetical protein
VGFNRAQKGQLQRRGNLYPGLRGSHSGGFARRSGRGAHG